MLRTLLAHLKDQKDISLTNDILLEVFSKCIMPLKHSESDLYNEIVNSLYIECYGEHFSEWLATKAVSEMKNADGSSGEHWTINQIDDVIRQYNLKSECYNRWDVYYVMNMYFSDYGNIFGGDTNTYIKLTKAWFEDIDVSEGKSYRYYMGVVKNK